MLKVLCTANEQIRRLNGKSTRTREVSQYCTHSNLYTMRHGCLKYPISLQNTVHRVCFHLIELRYELNIQGDGDHLWGCSTVVLC